MLNMKYSHLVKEAGCIPVMAYDIRSVEEYAKQADGLLLTGGFDIHVGRYGQIYQNMDEAAHFCATRDDMEFQLCRLFMERKKPILGIGRGMQVVNVALGGSLCRDVEQTSYERHTGGIVHPVQVKTESRLHHWFGDRIMVNSFHHQAVERLGTGLIPAAITAGGVIEAVEHETLPAAGLQWHLERMDGDERQRCSLLMQSLFGEG